MNLSKSKYCNAVVCPKMLWLSIYKPEVKEDVNNASVLDNGTEVGIYAKKLFGKYEDVEFNENLNQMIEDTKVLLDKENVVITEASFVYENNFCSVDILKKIGNDYEIYEVKSSTEVKDIYLHDVSYQVYVLRGLNLNVTKASIVHINADYERNGDIDINQLFKIVDVTQIADEKQEEIKNNILNINEYMLNVNEPDRDIDLYCFKPYDCPYFKYCTKHLPENNIFDVKRMRISSKIKFYKKDIYTFKDLLNENIDSIYKDQIEHELFVKDDLINVNNIKSFLKELSYPLYFLDFETFQEAIPSYDKAKPYMQIPFQYSIHYVNSVNDSVKHLEFLAEDGIDPRRKLAEILVDSIPENSCVIAYNMMFEKMVIKNLAYLYPDLKEKLMIIYNNIKDLMIPFKNHDYYVKEMKGSYSIKYVLPALFPDDEKLNYSNLSQVHNGSEASASYLELSKLANQEKEKLRNSLLKYCELDTWAMVKIWQKLLEIASNN